MAASRRRRIQVDAASSLVDEHHINLYFKAFLKEMLFYLFTFFIFMDSEKDITEIGLIERYPGQKRSLQDLFSKIAELPPQDQVTALRTLRRYLQESDKSAYRAEPSGLSQLIVDEKLLQDSLMMFDLGAGPGDLLQELATIYPELLVRGLDLNPGFVESFNASMRENFGSRGFMKVDLIDSPLQEALFQMGRVSSVASVLTLDRLLYPKVLIQNMARFTKAKILGALLPNIPEDDNPSRQGAEKIIYTKPESRIVPGRSIAEDRDMLRRYLINAWEKPVEIAEVPYTVSSSGDVQKYDLSVFYSK